MQPKSILFLMSFPETAAFEGDRNEVSACISELQQQKHVTCGDICKETLGDANKHDVVIVVAHYDVKAKGLALHDGVLAVTDFAAYLPTDFKGIIDLSVCYSVEMVDAIKRRCPLCRVMAAMTQVPLLSRILVYPQVAKHFLSSEGRDYVTAYNDVARLLHSLLAEMGDEADETPEMTLLGESKSSLYAPQTVSRNSNFIITVNFYYDRKNQTISFVQTGAKVRDSKLCNITLDEDAAIDVNLTFIGEGIEKLRIVDESGAKGVKPGRGSIRAYFVVNVPDDFVGRGFIVKAMLTADGEVFETMYCNINVGDMANDALAEVTMEDDKPHDEARTLDMYKMMADKNLLTFHSSQLILDSILKARSMGKKVEMARECLYENGLFYDEVYGTLCAALEKVNSLQNNIINEKDVSTELFRRLSREIKQVCNEVAEMNGAFQNIKKESGLKKEMKIQSFFAEMETEYLNIVKTIRDIKYQVDVLEKFEGFRMLLLQEKPTMDDIRKQVTGFAEIIENSKIDDEIFKPLKMASSTHHIKSKSGVSSIFIALFIAMAYGEIKLVEKGKRVADEFSKYLEVTSHDSYRRIFLLFKRLQEEKDNGVYENYLKNGNGRFSFSAYYIQRVIVNMC